MSIFSTLAFTYSIISTLLPIILFSCPWINFSFILCPLFSLFRHSPSLSFPHLCAGFHHRCGQRSPGYSGQTSRRPLWLGFRNQRGSERDNESNIETPATSRETSEVLYRVHWDPHLLLWASGAGSRVPSQTQRWSQGWEVSLRRRVCVVEVISVLHKADGARECVCVYL